jgi:hypothetical protein
MMPDESYVAAKGDEEPCSSQRHVDGRLSFCNRVKGHTGDHWTHWGTPFTWPNVRKESSAKAPDPDKSIEVSEKSRTPGSFAGVAREVARLRQELEKKEQEIDKLRARAIVAEHHKLLSLLGKSSYQEVVEEKLRVDLAESQVRVEELEAEGRALAEARDQLVASADAIRAECLKAGMQEPSTLLDYIRTVFYAYQRDRKNLTAAETALGDAQRQISALRDYVAHENGCLHFLNGAGCDCGLDQVLIGESRP